MKVASSLAVVLGCKAWCLGKANPWPLWPILEILASPLIQIYLRYAFYYKAWPMTKSHNCLGDQLCADLSSTSSWDTYHHYTSPCHRGYVIKKSASESERIFLYYDMCEELCFICIAISTRWCFSRLFWYRSSITRWSLLCMTINKLLTTFDEILWFFTDSIYCVFSKMWCFCTEVFSSRNFFYNKISFFFDKFANFCTSVNNCVSSFFHSWT